MKKKLCDAVIMLSRYFLYGFLIQLLAFNALFGKSGSAQLNTPIHANLQNISVSQVFDIIKKESGFTFVYDARDINSDRQVDIRGNNLKVSDILDALTSKFDFSFKTIGKTITVRKDVRSATRSWTDLPYLPVSSQMVTLNNYVAPLTFVFKVSGTVTDSSGNPLVGVSVQIKGTSRGTVTDAKGHYEIEAPEDATLIFSYVGYTNQETAVDGRTSLNITLKTSTSGLNEVVVVGYQSEEKRDMTSAVATVSGAQLNKRVATDPVNLLQGQLPGLGVTQNSGQPGSSGAQLLIRGVSTFSGAGNSPLVIVDGLPGNLSNLNPNDIESVTILKDAASAAIYGSRGANGVIVVKTKQGSKGGFSLEYSYNIGITNATKLPNVVTNSATFMELSNAARLNSGLQPLYTQNQIDLYKNATDRIKYPNYNWLNAIFKTAYTQNHYLNMSGGNDNTNYSLGVGITEQPGVMIGFDFKKYTLNLGLNSKINKRVNLGANINMKYSKQKYPEDGAGDFFLSALAQSPLYPPRMSNGNWVYRAYSNELGNKNPVALVGEDIRTRVDDYYLQGNLSLDVKIIDGLQWENRIGANYDANNSNDFRPVVPVYYYSDSSYGGSLDDGSPGLYIGRNSEVYLTGYSQFTYKKQFGDHNISALAGYQQEHDNTSFVNANRAGQFATNLLRELNAGPDNNPNNSGSSADWAIRSYYGNVHYTYKDKYLLGASVRYDGTSRLPSDTRWGLFYSFSGGWRISDEAFLKNVSWINDLKIRGSWGRLGNQNIGTYPYQSTLTERDYGFGGSIVTGFAANGLIDPSLTWETTQVLDLGIDLTAFNNKLSFTGDWFNKYTFNILRGSQVPLWLGLNAPTINNGAVRNKGFEVSIQYKDKIGQNFSYYAGGSVQTFKNSLVHFGQREISSNTIMQEGHEMNEYYLYAWDGIFQSQDEIAKSPKQPVTPTPGDLKFKDINGDGVINDQDRTYVKGIYPAFQYSFNLGGAYKNIDVNIQLYGSQGQKIYVTGWGIEPFRQGSVPTTDWLNAWTPQNHSTTMPKIYNADSYPAIQSYPSTYFLKDASFMRVKSVDAGYTLSSHVINEIGMKSLRIYFSADNLYTFSKFPGLDPERVNSSSSTGTRYVSYPQNRVYTFGVMAKF